MRNLSKRSDIAAFLAMDVMREAKIRTRQGEAICHMEVGQPGTRAPLLVRERAKLALDQELIGYTEALGLPSLRERIALHYQEAYGQQVSSDRVIVTTGSSAGFLLGFLATLDVGEKVAITQTGYPCYREILNVLGLSPHFLPIGFNTGWMPLVEDIKSAIEVGGVKAILLASPSNPTGVVLDNQLVEEIAKLCFDAGVWFVMDEIYHGLVYDKSPRTAAGLNDQTIVVNSFSKYYSMTGWRIGWMVVPLGLERRLEILSQHLYISAPTLSQIAAQSAFDALTELETIKEGYRENRSLLRNGLIEAGFDQFAPADGAFYIYVDVSAFTDDSLAFSEMLLREHGIAACPGLDFDAVDGYRMMRFSYAGSRAEIVEAVDRLKRAAFNKINKE